MLFEQNDWKRLLFENAHFSRAQNALVAISTVAAARNYKHGSTSDVYASFSHITHQMQRCERNQLMQIDVGELSVLTHLTLGYLFPIHSLRKY